MWHCQNTVKSYEDWKQNKIRHQLETGKYFESFKEDENL